MDAVKERAYEKLVQNLDDLIKLYRQLLDLARKEKEALINAESEVIIDINSQKEIQIQKIKLADTLRYKHAKELCVLVKADTENPRLLEIAQKLQGTMGDHLRNLHKTLDMIISRIIELNKDNDELAQRALKVLNGTMTNIKETLSGKKTYERKGQYKQGPEQSGNFISKEI
ncbi:MAG: flagellar protein FlgN [Bdellovibrionaceae bacterium]|nr:flagellar protein FlgN [Pseudobdellovibrionaceae bacterium]